MPPYSSCLLDFHSSDFSILQKRTFLYTIQALIFLFSRRVLLFL